VAHVKESVVVHWPSGRVPSYLEWYLDQLSGSDGNKATLELRVPGDLLGMPGGVNVGRDVTATFAPTGDELNRQEQRMSIRWAPKGGGPFPAFAGVLALSAQPGSQCLLTLEGDYEPPLGLAGEVFDAALGQRIAHATAQELLHRIKAVMEASARL
jgi:hypothetical protein